MMDSFGSGGPDGGASASTNEGLVACRAGFQLDGTKEEVGSSWFGAGPQGAGRSAAEGGPVCGAGAQVAGKSEDVGSSGYCAGSQRAGTSEEVSAAGFGATEELFAQSRMRGAPAAAPAPRSPQKQGGVI